MKSKNEYDYYKTIKKKALYIFNKHNLLLYMPNLNYNDYYYEMICYQEKFYNFLLDLFNREIFRFEYRFFKRSN